MYRDRKTVVHSAHKYISTLRTDGSSGMRSDTMSSRMNLTIDAVWVAAIPCSVLSALPRPRPVRRHWGAGGGGMYEDEMSSKRKRTERSYL